MAGNKANAAEQIISKSKKLLKVRKSQDEKNLFRLMSLAGTRAQTLSLRKNPREGFLDTWYILDRISFNRLLKSKDNDGKKMVLAFSQDDSQMFNHIWDVHRQKVTQGRQNG